MLELKLVPSWSLTWDNSQSFSELEVIVHLDNKPLVAENGSRSFYICLQEAESTRGQMIALPPFSSLQDCSKWNSVTWAHWEPSHLGQTSLKIPSQGGPKALLWGDSKFYQIYKISQHNILFSFYNFTSMSLWIKWQFYDIHSDILPEVLKVTGLQIFIFFSFNFSRGSSF